MSVTKIYLVTAANSAGYLVDGVTNKPLTLVRGLTYKFQVNAQGHPFWVQTTGNGYNLASIFDLGVTNNGTQSGTITFKVPETAPDTLYYQCQYHPMMYGTFSIVDQNIGQGFTTMDPGSATIEDFVDKVFYGVKQNRLTGKATIDTITGDEPIRLPDQYSVRTDDYVNWMWSYNRFVYSYDNETGRLLMEVI
jgi:hypothetical protein